MQFRSFKNIGKYLAVIIGGIWALLSILHFIVEKFKWPDWTYFFFFVLLVILSIYFILSNVIKPVVVDTKKYGQKVEGSLPFVSKELYGRKRELKAIKLLLRKSNLISVIGDGGMGKTHFVSKFMSIIPKKANTDFLFFGLEEVRTKNDLIAMLCRQLNLKAGNDCTISTITTFFYGRSSIIILDNCEHISTMIRDVIKYILPQSKKIKIILTSRSPLNVDGEKILKLKAFQLPKSFDDLNNFIKNPAVNLFISYSDISTEQLKQNPKLRVLIHELIQFTDGIPLAIKIISGQAKIMSLQEILAQADSLLHMSSDITYSLKHEKIFECFEWSFNLLEDHEKEIFMFISIFEGGIPLEGIYHIFCKIDGTNAIIRKLINLNLIEKLEDIEDTRYNILPLLKKFLLYKLCENKKMGFFEEKHANFYSDFIKDKEIEIYSSDAERCLDQLDLEINNLQKAMHHFLSQNQFDRLSEFTYLYWHWFLRGHWREMSVFINKLINNLTSFEDLDKAQILLSYGTMLWANGQLKEAENRLIEAIDLFKSLSIISRTAEVTHILGHVYHQKGQNSNAKKYFEQSCHYWQKENNQYWVSVLLNDIGAVAIDLSDFKLAKQSLLKSTEISKKWQIKHSLGNALMYLGLLNRIISNDKKSYNDAKTYFSEAIQIFSSLGYSRGIASALRNRADLESKFRNYNKATRDIEKSLKIQRKISHKIGIARNLESLASIECKNKDFIKARTLFDFSKYVRGKSHSQVNSIFKDERKKLEEDIVKNLGEYRNNIKESDNLNTIVEYALECCQLKRKNLIYELFHRCQMVKRKYE